ncbi:MAG: ribonuclease R, partial [Deltaproteobacteria bacterium]|nr:ribonuclease R [Deltaproteobacteria bacterium]
MDKDIDKTEEDPSKKIVEFMKEGAYKPMSFKELVHVFGVKRDRREKFKRLIKRLVSDGTLIEIRGGRYGLPSKMNLITGELICHPDGFGFVRPDEGGTDVFIAPRRLAGAMHGDTVAARVEGYKEGGKREGRIIRVIKRAHKVITGRIEKEREFSSVIPSD